MIINKVLSYFKPCWASIFILFICIAMMGFLPPISSAVKLVVYVIGFLSIAKHGMKFNAKNIYFVIFLILNIIVCQPDHRFMVWERLAFFVILFLTVSSFVVNKYAIEFRWQALKIFLVINVLLSTLSFFAFFLGINMMERQGEALTDYSDNAGWFSGFYNHSMILGPMSAMAVFYIVYLALNEKKNRTLFWALPCIGSVLFAASRTAFVAMLIGLGFMIFHYSQNKKKFIKILMVVGFASVMTFPFWNSGLDRMVSKQNSGAEFGQFGSRQNKWENRIDEFSSSPLWGIGFSSVSIESGDCMLSEGRIEPGSSWLAILSMTGIVGLCFVISFFRRAYVLIKNSIAERSILLMALLIFIVIHMLGEGYIFAGGNPLCVIAWLIVGCSNDLAYDNVYENRFF